MKVFLHIAGNGTSLSGWFPASKAIALIAFQLACIAELGREEDWSI